MKRLAIAAYIIAIHAALLVALLRPSLIQRLTGGPDPWNSRMHRTLVAVDRNVPAGMDIFLGDSITQRLPVARVSSAAVNYGIGAQTTRQLAANAGSYKALRTAKAVYLMIGVNDLAHSEAPDFNGVLSHIPVSAKLIWTGVAPATGIDGIEAANEMARSICSGMRNCTFVEAPVDVQDLDPDGVHWTPSAYDKWIDALKLHSPNPAG